MRYMQYAWRQMRHSREATVLAVVMLALGIGANAAMFTIAESVLLHRLPYRDPARLVNISASGPASTGSVSWPDYRDIRNQSHLLASVAGYSTDTGVVEAGGTPLGVVVSEVTPNLFAILGTAPSTGRTFLEEEGRPGGGLVVVLSAGLCRRLFGDDAAVGRRLRVNGQERTVLGVMPEDFRFPESAGPRIATGLWLPMQPTNEMLADRGYRFFTILAKAAPQAAIPRIARELHAIAGRIHATDPHADPNGDFAAVSYLEAVTGSVRPVFLALLAALGLCLLIACANVSNLLITGVLARRHEFAIHAALGSGPGRLVGQVFAEAALLSLLGCSLGCLVAYWITLAVHKLPEGMIPRSNDIQVHWPAIGALAAIALASTVLSAVIPALFAARTDPQAVLRGASRGASARSVSAAAGGWLVAGEVSLAVLLLIATGLLFRTLWGLQHVRLGFDTANIIAFTAMPARATGFADMPVSAPGTEPVSVAITVYKPLIEALQSIPGVRDAALATAPPFSGVDLETSFRVVGRQRDPRHPFEAKLTALSGGYERALGTPILQGRAIGDQDDAGSPFVATVNETFSRMYFPGGDALGQRLDLGGRATGMLRPYTVVGIIADQVDSSTAQPVKPTLTLAYRQIPAASVFYPALLETAVHFVVRGQAGVTIASAVRGVFHQTAADMALEDFQTMQEAVDRSNFGARLGFLLIGAFAGLAVLMVIAGLYSVLGQVVGYRRKEFGLRLALGATRQSILIRVLLLGSAKLVPGLAAGIVVALAGGHLIESFLYGVHALDGITYLLVAIAVLLVGAIGGLAPSWRAASVDPMKALREE